MRKETDIANKTSKAQQEKRAKTTTTVEVYRLCTMSLTSIRISSCFNVYFRFSQTE